MISRRFASVALLGAGGPFTFGQLLAQEDLYAAVPTADLRYPRDVRPNVLFGNKPATQQQINVARMICENAPKSSPLEIARYFLDPTKVNPTYTRQWSPSLSWNPLIVEFFRSVGYQASSDMVPWCAAFVNWCLVRAGRKGSGSPSSQSFLNSSEFEATSAPILGSIAVFTALRCDTNVSTGLGHVAFVASLPTRVDLKVLGGNQSASGFSSEINERLFPMRSACFQRCTVRDPAGTCKKSIRVYLKLVRYVRAD